MKILFVFAHPDDEAYGAGGTIAKLSADNEVYVLALCQGNRPGAETVATSRQEAFFNTCSQLGVTSMSFKHYNDLDLEFLDAVREIEKAVNDIKPEIVYTNNISDLHKDHRIMAEAALAVCRPKPNSTVKKLYMCEMPAATEWSFGLINGSFNPNTFVDITDYIDLKKAVLGNYTTETYEYPDARSVKAMEVMAMQRGKQAGVMYAEAFQLVFSLDRKTP